MSKITRQLFLPFGSAGSSDNFGQFGSKKAGSPVKTKNIATIQALDAWVNGWQDAVVSANKAPYLEDMNSAMLVFGNMIAYLMQQGIPEWDPDTTYYTGSYVTYNTLIYESHADDNTGNTPPSASVGQDPFWRVMRTAGNPSGVIVPFAGAGSVPWDYLLCDGSAVSRSQYSALFAAIGTTWGAGDGITTFNVPDLRGKSLFGNAGSSPFSAVGASGGSQTHTHTEEPHDHSVPSLSLNHDTDFGVTPFTVTSDQFSLAGSAMGINPTPSGIGAVDKWKNIRPKTIADTTGDATPTIDAASNVPPFAVIQYIIKT